MATYVLGACHTGSCWNGVKEHLESKGHHVFAPTTGGNLPDADKQVTAEQVIQPILDVFVQNDLPNYAV